MKLKIGALAKMIGINIQSIRYYERRGLLLPSVRLESGYRLYDEKAVKRLKFIRYSKKLGFSLKEIERLLSLHPKSIENCEEVRSYVEQKLKVIDEKIEGLKNIRLTMAHLVNSCTDKQPTEDCPILAGIAEEG